MIFCQNCKGLIGKSEQGKFICLSCGFSYDGEFNLSSTEKLDLIRDIAIIDEKSNEILPKINRICQRCGNEEAYFWHMITTASDEADTIFHRCTRCGLTVQKGGQRGGR